MRRAGFQQVPPASGGIAGRARGATRADDAVAAAHAVLLAGLQAEQPDFLRERYMRLAAILEMLEDDDWWVRPQDRQRVITVLGCLVMTAGNTTADHTTLIELVSRELRHDLQAHQEFRRLCRRAAQRHSPHDMDREQWLAERRDALQARMRVRRERDQHNASGSVRRWWSLLNF